MLGGYNQNLLRSKFTLIFRSVFIVVSLLALQACISSSGGRSSNSNNAIPLVSGGVTSKLSRVSNGASMSRVRQIFGDPEDRDYISGFEVWQYCSTGMFSDDFVAIVFIDGKVAERKKYVRRIDGFCSSFFKSASDLNFYSVQVALQERSQKNIARQTAEAIERRLAAAKQVQEKAEQAQEKAKSPDIAESFNQTALSVNFARGPQHMNDVAVIIGNANYGKHGSDIPDVKPAYADAESIRKWLIEAKGLREGNIIFLRDATSAQMTGVFGSQSSHKGKLFNWTKKGISNVYVYYAGHGAPAGKEGSAFLVPSDVSSDSIELTGYPLKRLYANLEKLPAKSVTVILESCFSGAAQGGYVINKTSGILISPKIPRAPGKLTVISAGAADQIASWEEDNSNSLFTKYFLTGLGGFADIAPHGDNNDEVSYAELEKYLEATTTYFARRYYGRDQLAQFVVRQ